MTLSSNMEEKRGGADSVICFFILILVTKKKKKNSSKFHIDHNFLATSVVHVVLEVKKRHTSIQQPTISL